MRSLGRLLEKRSVCRHSAHTHGSRVSLFWVPGNAFSALCATEFISEAGLGNDLLSTGASEDKQKAALLERRSPAYLFERSSCAQHEEGRPKYKGRGETQGPRARRYLDRNCWLVSRRKEATEQLAPRGLLGIYLNLTTRHRQNIVIAARIHALSAC